MLAHLRACLWLLMLTVILCCVVYPAILLGVGQTVFPSQAEGSLIYDKNGNAIGSRLIAQPFVGDQFFHPRPSAVSYNAAGSGASNWGANNVLLRDRVARQLGPIVKYRGGSQAGQLVAADIESWFQKRTDIVAHWASAYPTLATNWVKSDPLHAAYVTEWSESHTAELGQWKTDNPGNDEPKPEDLAVLFFTSIAKEQPGKFPGRVTPESQIEPIATGMEIQSIFFDLWRQDHADVDLEPVPADMVMASGSGLDPHITLKNALYQLDRVAVKWAELTQRDAATVRKEIETMLREKAAAPLGGLVGVDLVNVLEVNLTLIDLYGQ